MGFIPMDLGQSGNPACQPHPGHSFEFSPTPRAELAPEPHDVPDPAADGYRFNFLDLADNLEIHESILTSMAGPGLQHPLRRQHFPRQPLFRHRRVIERLGKPFEDGFHDVVGVAAIE